jgi:hypothetical protein
MHPIIFELSFQAAIVVCNRGRVWEAAETVGHLKNDDLDALQKSRLSEFEEVLNPLIAIEDEFGRGACLNLKMEKEMNFLKTIMYEYDPPLYSPEHFRNAERYRKISGDNWVWTEWAAPGYENHNPYIDQTSATVEKMYSLNLGINDEGAKVEFRMENDNHETRRRSLH